MKSVLLSKSIFFIIMMYYAFDVFCYVIFFMYLQYIVDSLIWCISYFNEKDISRINSTLLLNNRYVIKRRIAYMYYFVKRNTYF